MAYLYPVTIVKTRYGGAYEGSEWAAFNLNYWQLPNEAFGSDESCATWWAQPPNTRFVGRGNTPTEAFNDLYHNKAN